MTTLIKEQNGSGELDKLDDIINCTTKDFIGIYDKKNMLENVDIPDYIVKEFPHFFSGFDFENQPVWIIPFGQWNVKGVLNDKEENEKYIRAYFDASVRNVLMSVKLKNVKKLVVIVDLDKYEYSQLASIRTIKFILSIIKAYEHIFEIVAYGFCVNLGYFSEKLVSTVRPFIGPVMDRITFRGTEKEKYIVNILKKIPASQLPEKYGGMKGYNVVKAYQ